MFSYRSMPPTAKIKTLKNNDLSRLTDVHHQGLLSSLNASASSLLLTPLSFQIEIVEKQRVIVFVVLTNNSSNKGRGFVIVTIRADHRPHIAIYFQQ
jgi:hypothetical protein